MSDPHDREPVDQATIDCWRANYGLDKRTPAQAAQWWSENMRGFAPSGCVAALGVALDELAALRKDAERYRWLRHGDNDERCIRLTSEGHPYMLRSELLDRCIDETMADDADEAAHTVAAPVVGAA